ncbi:MAG: hypothetical protein IJD48_03335 [Clostridia bacterium]|nr:hypothetical protein [Clostridia bacterium]
MEEKKQKSKEKNYVSKFFTSLIISIVLVVTPVIIWIIVNENKKFDIKATYTSFEYDTPYSQFYIEIEPYKNTTLYNTDFVLYINGTPTKADGFLIGKYIYNDLDINTKTTIKVIFKCTKSQIDEPLKLYVRHKQLKFNETTTIK